VNTLALFSHGRSFLIVTWVSSTDLAVSNDARAQ